MLQASDSFVLELISSLIAVPLGLALAEHWLISLLNSLLDGHSS